ncbi:hypothetical protein [Alistipes sp.]|jgi:hypothetical protein|uniref:hypothetical protein n=1 Tax=Alistipes sp. TaxID=1872444 RepID=UPI00205B64BF|nr:hypothetical protein [Alistipes sp.]MBS7026533.1 hypothetical protein [Alistipes sp.]DAL88753.1 MAG TPA: hypothetical protein [Caudoviricetes sp.]
MKYQIKRIDIINRWKYRGCGHFVLIGLASFHFSPNSFKWSAYFFGIELAVSIDRLNNLKRQNNEAEL